jgi:hypothetical protein
MILFSRELEAVPNGRSGGASVIDCWQPGKQNRMVARLDLGLDFPAEHFLHLAVKADTSEMVAYTPWLKPGGLEIQNCY